MRLSATLISDPSWTSMIFSFVSAMTDSDYSQTCDLSIRTQVENMAYELSGSTNSIMYFYDVFVGPEDMLQQPFGRYNAQ